jgi:ubiquinone/menaquinone biosynthesis C-methylase UbiE
MSQHTDLTYLVNEEYDDAADLETRIQIQDEFNTHPQSWFEWFFDQLDLPVQSRILELGCGSGGLWVENRHRLPSTWEITLSDLSTGMLEEARQNLGFNQDQFTLEVIDSQLIPFADSYFNAVIANGLFDHVPDRSQAFSEVRRVLKPGGCLYASAGSQTHLQELEALVKPFLPHVNYGGDHEEFGLENGLAQLAEWFPGAAMHRYRGALIFKEIEPILAYVLSEGTVKSELTGRKRAEFTRFLEQKLARHGEIRVTVDKGLIKAYKEQALI